MGNRNGSLSSLYEKIEGLELSLAKKRNEYVRNAFRENGVSIKLKYNPNPDDFDEINTIFCDQFPETVTIPGRRGDFSIYITEVYTERVSDRTVLFIRGIDTEDLNIYEEYADGYIPEVCRFINYCLKQEEYEKEQENV